MVKTTSFSTKDNAAFSKKNYTYQQKALQPLKKKYGSFTKKVRTFCLKSTNLLSEKYYRFK